MMDIAISLWYRGATWSECFYKKSFEEAVETTSKAGM